MIGRWLKARKAEAVSVQQACQPTHPLKRHPDQRYQKPGKAAPVQDRCAHMLADIGIERQSGSNRGVNTVFSRLTRRQNDQHRRATTKPVSS